METQNCSKFQGNRDDSVHKILRLEHPMYKQPFPPFYCFFLSSKLLPIKFLEITNVVRRKFAKQSISSVLRYFFRHFYYFLDSTFTNSKRKAVIVLATTYVGSKIYDSHVCHDRRLDSI